jgi:hypothetical protein
MRWNPFHKGGEQDPFMAAFLAAAQRNGVEISQVEGDRATASSHGPHSIYLGNIRPRWGSLPQEERGPGC